jgi:hypothetical protein
MEVLYKDTEERAKKDATLQGLAERQKVAWSKWTAVIALYDSLFGKLAVPDEKGSVLVVNVIKEWVIDEALKGGGYLLILKTQKAGGSAYTKKNMWTSLGAMPFFVAGGAVASFVLLEGASGKISTAGVIPIHGGYRRVDAIENAFR